MKEQNNIDKLFKSKLGRKDFEPSPGDWSAMSKILDEKEDRKVRYLPFIWFFGSLGVLIAFSFVWFSTDIGVSKQKMVPKDAIPTKQSEEHQDLEGFAGIDKSQEIKGKEIGETTAKYEEILNTTKEESNTKKIDLQNPQHAQLNASQFEESRTTLINNKAIGKENVDLKNTSQLRHVPLTTETSLLNNAADEVNAPNNLDIEAANSTDIVNHEIVLEDVTSTSAHSINENDKSMASINFIDMVLSGVKTSNLLELSLPLISMDISDYDQFEPHFQIGMGGEFLASSSNLSGFKLGVLGDYHLSPKLVFNIGINYLQQNNLNIYSKLRLDPIYDFGNSYTVYGIHALSMSSISIPLGLHYKVGRNQFGGGYEALFNMGVNGDVQEVALMESITRSKVQSVVETVKNGWVDMSAFNNNNGRLFISYRRQIFESLYLGGKANYQLKHILREQPTELESQSTDRLFFGLNVQMFIK